MLRQSNLYADLRCCDSHFFAELTILGTPQVIPRRPTSGLWHNLTVPQHTASRGPGRPPAAKAAETRERIIGAAREVFSELGYDAATFQAIAIRAGLTRPAINHYFASKRVLWAQVVEQTDAQVVSAGQARAKSETNLLNRLSAFFTAAIQADSEDRSAAAFLVTSVLESQRHPELSGDEHDSLRNSREFIAWAVDDAIKTGELTTDTDVSDLVEMLVAMMWGIGFYAGFVGGHDELSGVVEKFELLLAGKLWQFSD
ncbi:TetR family transcriptional regulator [Mycolicibacterium gadium]|uniref:TetR family transcriptional regulator n=1 Tax=Mycolicibacterium gadium TaxID=1794 RepID=A0A7I7WTP9_MYCGU|nr:TetR family transcriptional regulator [Mycolicibacterium gadium]